MKLEDLGLSDVQIRALEKKKVVSVEALVRRPPLHYYDFSTLYALSPYDEDTSKMLERRRPFAVRGKCSSYDLGFSEKTKVVKIRLVDDKSGNTLFVNIMGYDLFRQSFLNNMPESPHRMNISVPLEIPLLCKGDRGDISSSCLKQIDFMNSLDERSPRDFIGLKTGGTDCWSKIKYNEIADEQTREYVRTILPREGDAVNALRWYARGLRIDLAIKKVLLDSDSMLRDMIYDKTITVGGFITYSEDYGTFSVINPALFVVGNNTSPFYLQYGQIKGITPDRYREIVKRGIDEMSSFDFIPHEVCSRLGIPSFKESARLMHFPSSYRDVKAADGRAVTEDLLYLALKMTEKSRKEEDVPGIIMEKYGIMKDYAASLPFDLTRDQKDAVNAICKKIKHGERANTLVQGDVGTGKTAVAVCLMLIAADSGYQAALAAPYTALASQHYRDISEAAEKLGVKAAFLTSDVTGKKRKEALEAIRSGDAKLIIGTHSIFAKDVEYFNLALIIEDEEHKFGVIHRENLSEKALPGAHHITMSATPIPKTVAATIYDETTEIITIKEKPAGRIPIQTAVCRQDKTAMDFMAKEIRNGHQCYVVCPSIESGSKNGDKVFSIEEKAKVYHEYFDSLGMSMAVVTGKVKAAEREEIMGNFSAGNIDILMATTVIEVGINVPNATVMVITGADRFGFSTLHQLRGRVGRGKNKSFCILQTDGTNEKLEFMCETTDGFKIAEKDLELRGPGSLFGERQSGDNYYISLMLANPDLYKKLKPIAKGLWRDRTGWDIIRRYEEIFRSEEER